MQTYPKLYKLDSKGTIRVWHMEQEANRHRTISGIQSGQMVTSNWTEVSGKNLGKANETSAIEQAQQEIEAKYRKQKKLGYVDNLNDMVQTNQTHLKNIPKPMLAKCWKDYSDKIDLSSGNWIMQCKFNGMRCIATKDGLFTRRGERYLSCPHIEESLHSFFEKYPDAVLDGELFNEKYRQQLNEISKLVRKTVHLTPEDLQKSREMVLYYVYDGYVEHDWQYGPKEEYAIRRYFIDREITNRDYIQKVEDWIVTDIETLNRLYQSLVDAGHEGAMLRNIHSGYEHKRSKNLLKLKPEDDAEAIILDIQEGEGNWAKAGKIITLQWKDIIFNATFKGTFDESVKFLQERDKWLGQTVTFLYNGLTGKGVPNYARVDIKNCLKE